MRLDNNKQDQAGLATWRMRDQQASVFRKKYTIPQLMGVIFRRAGFVVKFAKGLLAAHSTAAKMFPRVNTTAHLEKLRSLMRGTKYVEKPLSAYIIPSGDAHLSEYIADCDERRAFVSGFDGSAGTAIVTDTKAALWTDGRYYLQAEQQLDSNWDLIKDGLPSSPSQGEWLCSTMPTGSIVGVDPFLISGETWSPLLTKLECNGISLVQVHQNLVDLVWVDRPPRTNNPVIPLALKYTGRSWQEKIQEVRGKMIEKGSAILVITALDEIAWLLNLRGSDILYNPVFFAYVIITVSDIHLFMDPVKVTDEVKKHLGPLENSPTVTYHPYDKVKDIFVSLVNTDSEKVWISLKSSYALISMVPATRSVVESSPIQLLKAIKNPTEIQGMQNCSIRDAVALCEYYAWLETEVPKNTVTEVSGAKKLQEFRSQQADYVGESFGAISSSGFHGAVIHYSPSEATDRPITVDEMYLCDSGGQYLDGTTDVTRTLHFGMPTEYEKECFTRVLKGHIALSSLIFPRLIKGQMLDTVARLALWEVGLDYLHGTGHGVGAYLNVHEGPMGIGQRVLADDPGIQENMILTDEPGYYESGKFGCRVENVIMVKQAKTKFSMPARSFLTFEPLTLVPIQRKLIQTDLLTAKELQWLNDYHQKTRETVGKLLKEQGREGALKWLIQETEPISV